MNTNITIEAAAKQLARLLFNPTPMGGSVTATRGNLIVAAGASWQGERRREFAGYPVEWR